ncbi:MAG: exodeoxyribonuclease V subunit alpha [Desulfobacterales bacterium]|nr:exodeoxyribonuclease V subunit alpha [Desulfobacterales bacterium]
MYKEIIRLLCDYKIFNDIDIHFADFIVNLAKCPENQELYLSSAMLSNVTTQEKHICMSIESKAGRLFTKVFSNIPENIRKNISAVQLPKLHEWRTKLKETSVVGLPGEYKPIILDKSDRLYLYRYWVYENELSSNIKTRFLTKKNNIDYEKLKEGFNRYFGTSSAIFDWQKIAVFSALMNNFSVISGGPGTGKTYTVTKILALLLEQNIDIKIKLCAPTGKAAARLQESIRQAKEKLPCSDEIKQKIPEETFTLHRLLGAKINSPFFLHDSKNPLFADVILIDETSMVSLSLMTKLMMAIPYESKIILLGDKDQLSSVEAGSVLSDICESGGVNCFTDFFAEKYSSITNNTINNIKNYNESFLNNSIIHLQHSFRFGANSNIAKVSRSVNQGDSEAAIKLIKENQNDVSYKILPQKDNLKNHLAHIFFKYYESIYDIQELSHAYNIFESFRILCAVREGDYGINNINELCKKLLGSAKRVDTEKKFYKGMPLIINRNDYNLKLFNGDIGILWETQNKEIRAFFSNQDGSFRSIPPARLPEHEIAYAMTIHKSQGSEFDNVLLIFPDKESPILTKELIYTGITRARKHVEIWGDDNILMNSIKKRVERTSGLKDSLNYCLTMSNSPFTYNCPSSDRSLS